MQSKIAMHAHTVECLARIAHSLPFREELCPDGSKIDLTAQLEFEVVLEARLESGGGHSFARSRTFS
jgi:hypothetical protein